MKRILMLLMAVLALMPAVKAAELPDPAEIKDNDLVVAVKEGTAKNLPCLIFRSTYFALVLHKSKSDQTEIRIPTAAVQYAFYSEADNADFIEGMKAFNARKYSDALEGFEAAAEQSTSFLTAQRKEEFLQYINYYSGMSLFYLGDFEKAIKALDMALQPKDAIFKFQGEYYKARCLEAQGKFGEADSKYSQLVVAVYPEMIKRAEWGKKWEYFAKLGQQRARVLQAAQRAGQESTVQKALGEFEALLKQGEDKIDADLKLDAVRVRANAEKYLAQKDPAKYQNVVKLLEKPTRDAVAENNKNALSWMYMDTADCYYGLMEAEKDPAKKKDLAEKARFEYLRISLVMNVGPADLYRAYTRSAKLFEQLKDKDWMQRALQQYKFASSSRFKDWNGEIQEEVKKLSEQVEAAEKAAAEAKAKGPAKPAAKPAEKPAEKPAQKPAESKPAGK